MSFEFYGILFFSLLVDVLFLWNLFLAWVPKLEWKAYGVKDTIKYLVDVVKK